MRNPRRRAVPVFREVVLGRPDRVEADLLGRAHQLHLLVDDLVLGPLGRVLEEVKHPEAHARPSLDAVACGIPAAPRPTPGIPRAAMLHRWAACGTAIAEVLLVKAPRLADNAEPHRVRGGRE